MQIDRENLIQQLLNVFQTIPEVHHVALRGSILSGNTDRFSDIDLLIDGASITTETLATLILQHMDRHFEIEFFDWATSLMPNEYVVTFYLKNTSIFWNIDVQLISSSRQQPSCEFMNQRIHHLLKLWILNLKYLQRKQYDKLTIKKLASKLAIPDDTLSDSEMMRKIFETIQNESDRKLNVFLLACEKELEQYEKQLV